MQLQSFYTKLRDVPARIDQLRSFAGLVSSRQFGREVRLLLWFAMSSSIASVSAKDDVTETLNSMYQLCSCVVC